jgi:hypothetical protein
MSVLLRRMLAVLSVLGALVLVLAAAGLIPPEEPEPVRVEPFSIEKAIVPSSKILQSDRDAGPASTARALRFVPLCEAPLAGARWFKLALSAQQEGLLVFCKQGYELFAVSERSGELSLARVARFKAHAELPGGAAAGDFDGDGLRDLVLGVASRAGVVHRSGAGVFWLRGRAQGGFEPARILAEISSAAIGAFARAGARADELFVLTSGDVAAQRPAELWLFGGEPSLSRKHVLPAGLDPRGLALRAGAEPERVDAFVLSGQPGQLLRVTYDLSSHAPVAAPVGVALRGAQAFAHEPSLGDALYLRDATTLYRVEQAPTLSLSAFAREARVGPFVLGDLDGNLKPDVFAAIEAGLSWLGASEKQPEELALPEDLKVLDVESVHMSGPVRSPLALISGRPDARTLSLLILPAPPWQASAIPALLASELEPGQSPAEVALE